MHAAPGSLGQNPGHAINNKMTGTILDEGDAPPGPASGPWLLAINLLNAAGVLVCSYIAVKPSLTSTLLLGIFAAGVASIFIMNILYLRLGHPGRRYGLFTHFVIGVICSSILFIVTLAIAPAFSRRIKGKVRILSSFPAGTPLKWAQA